MPLKRPQLVNGEIYHIVMRAIDGVELFKDTQDYLRIIHDLFEFNDDGTASSGFRMRFSRGKTNATASNVTGSDPPSHCR